MDRIALDILKKRYLLRNDKGKIIESPSQMFKRTAKVVSKGNKKLEKEFFKMMNSLDFLPNSPTLMNAGTLGQLSACFVLPINDSIESIYTTLKNAALIHQSGGGTGFNFSNIRPKNDIVKSSKGKASGPISFIRLFNASTDVIKQGGKRRGANIAILNVDHPDILEFINAKQYGLFNFNFSVAITDDFMRRLKKNQSINLINPKNNKIIKKFKARKIWNEIIYNAWLDGDPGIIFIDEINRKHPIKEKIAATNPCVSGDSLISTEDGLIPISKLHNPMRIMTKERTFNNIHWIGKTGIKDVFKVKTKAGYEVKATEDHLFLTENNKWKKVKELNSNDKLVLQRKNNFGKLKVKKKIALMLGWLVGDGYLTKNGRVVFYFNNEEKLEMLDFFKNYLDNLNKKHIKPNFRNNEFSLKYGKKISKMFTELGLKYAKAPYKEIPESVFKMDKNSMKYFLSALFSADGSVQGNRKKGVSIRLASSSLKLLKQVQLLLLQFNILSKIYENRRNAGLRKLPDSKRQLKEYFCNADHELVISRESMFKFMKEIVFCLKTKNLKFELIKPSDVYKDNVDLSVKIEKIGKEEVFDLQEPITNSFIVNGIVVHNCGEQPLLDYESCNLGSINLSNFVKNNKIDFIRLKKIIYLAVEFLDNVIDINKYPLKEIEKKTKENRKIGLGIMGFAEMLIKLGINYNSIMAIRIAKNVMNFITFEARNKSIELGRRKGNFLNLKNSKFKVMRNATITTIAPTGTLSLIAETSSGIEPLFAVKYNRLFDGKNYKIVNKLYKKYPKKLFVTFDKVKPEQHVKIQAAFQKYTDNAVSKTVNLPNKATKKDVDKIFKLAYESKCKGITVYRYGSKKGQVICEVC